MKFRVIGGPLSNGVDVEAKHSDAFKSIYKKLQKAVGKAVSIEGYDLFTSATSGAAGHYTPVGGPLRSTDTPDSVNLDRKQKEPHVLLLVQRDEHDADRKVGITRTLSRSTSTSHGAGEAASQETTSSASVSPMRTPRAIEGYRRRMQAIFLKYDPGKIDRADLALERYAGYEEEVIQQLVKKYGPEPAAGEVDTSPAAIERALAAAARKSTVQTPASANRKPNEGASYRDRLIAIYSTYEPEKLSKVDGTLKRYAGREEEVVQQLVKKYGPEPPISTSAAPLSAIVASTPATTTAAISPEPREPIGDAALTPAYELTPATSTTAADSLPITPRNPPDDFGGGAVDGNGNSSVASAPVAATTAPTAGGPLSYRERLTAMYATYDPSKLRLVDGTLKKYEGREAAVLNQLVKMYGPEPSPVRVAAAEEAALSAARARRGSDPAATATAAPTVEEPTSATSVPAPAESFPVPAVTEVVNASPLSPPTETSVTEKVAEAAETVAAASPEIEEAKAAAAETNKEEKRREKTGDRYRERLVALYHAYNPSKLHTVEGTLKKFAGKEEAAIQQLVRRYGPEPPALTTQEALGLLKGASGSSPMTSPRTQNAPTKDISADVTDHAASASSSGSPKPVSATEKVPDEHHTYRERMRAILVAHDPDKLDKVDLILSRYHGKEEEVIARLEQRYGVHNAGDEVPSPASPFSFEEVAAQPPSPAAASPPQTGATEDDDATRPTAPPSQRSSSSHTSRCSTPAPPPPPAVEPPVVVPVNVTEPQTLPHATPAKAAASAAPAVQPARRMEHYIAVVKVAASHLESLARRSVLQRYWSSWRRHHINGKAAALLHDELWVMAVPPSAAKSSAGGADKTQVRYRLNDAVQPPYTVADLSVVVTQEEQCRTTSGAAVFSSEGEIAARALLSALRHCVESRVVEVRSAEEEQLASDFLAHWTIAEHMCPVTDSPEFARALHQAAHLVTQLDDLMTVIRTQAGQLQQLKGLHKDVLQRMESVQASAADVERLQTQLEDAKAHCRELEEELKRVSARSRSGLWQHAGDGSKASPPSRRAYPTVEERKDAQIAKLQQELAKTRNSLFASKEAEEKMKVQVQQSAAREARREREARRRESSPGHHSRPVSQSPRRGCLAAATPRGAFSQAIALDSTPRWRSRESPAQVEHNGRAISSIRKSGLDAQDCSNVSVNSSTPWPTSRFIMTEEIERGPCPNCLTPLTSCSAEAKGPANAKAAFCFSCRRSFTFGELRARDARDAVESL